MTEPITAAERARLVAELVEVGLSEDAAREAIARSLGEIPDDVDT